MTKETTQQVNFRVFRFNADEDYLPYYQNYNMEVTSKEVILDILNKIRDQDSSFSYSRNCSLSSCEDCAVKINGRPTLACKESVKAMIELFGSELTIEPLSKKRAIRDMIIDKSDFLEKYDSIKPYNISNGNEYLKESNEMQELSEIDSCVTCGVCYYSCPVVEVNEDFLGPAAFVKAYYFETGVRDETHRQRIEDLHREKEGLWDCVKCYECAEVCPSGVDPIGKMTKLHNMLYKEGDATSSVATSHIANIKDSIGKHGILAQLGSLSNLSATMKMYKKGKTAKPWSVPASGNLDEIQKLIESSSTSKF
ncbi:MAG: succinate dehydrogenase/fumarate reductase iron-sulfur subunit [Sulfurimonas sp.]|nr:succinate dehydrogenase/fumarate reductase iron-sulfur subunit [Sulfurimonas sp.]